MDFLFAILPAVLIPLAISIILPWVYGQSKKEEGGDTFVSRTKFPSRFTLCSIIALIITIVAFAVVIVLIAIFENDFPIHSWIALGLSAIFVISIPLLLTLLALRTYEIIRSDGIVVQRLFKRKFIRYSEMVSYHYSFNQLTVYNKEHKPILGVYDNRVGMKALLNQLDCRGISRE